MNQTKSGLFVPGTKLSERVRQIAWALFIEAWKGDVQRGRVADEETTKKAYKQCIEHAKVIAATEDEDQ